MVSEKNTKIIRSLSHKKYRQQYKFFIAEGRKIVIDMLITGFHDIYQLYVSMEALEAYRSILEQVKSKVILLEPKHFSKISNLDSPPDMILIGHIPSPVDVNLIDFSTGFHLYLDQVQDPGNMGTIFRTAEWFGVKSIGMSQGCADLFHPKVVQASMGSFWRVPYWLGDLPTVPGTPIIGADLQGSSLYKAMLPGNALLAIGSEGQGLSSALKSRIDQYLCIPSYSPNIESLNAANATAIILSEFKRQSVLNQGDEG